MSERERLSDARLRCLPQNCTHQLGAVPDKSPCCWCHPGSRAKTDSYDSKKKFFEFLYNQLLLLTFYEMKLRFASTAQRCLWWCKLHQGFESLQGARMRISQKCWLSHGPWIFQYLLRRLFLTEIYDVRWAFKLYLYFISAECKVKRLSLAQAACSSQWR